MGGQALCLCLSVCLSVSVSLSLSLSPVDSSVVSLVRLCGESGSFNKLHSVPRQVLLHHLHKLSGFPWREDTTGGERIG